MDTFYGEENQENNIKMLKNKMTLDFNSPTSHTRKAKLIKTCILESPDLKMLKLASPELERMIIAQNGCVTTTPTPSSIMPYFLKQEQEVTEEQEQYARGFVEALNQLHQTANGGQQHHPANNGHHPNPHHPSNHCLNSSQLSNTSNNNNSNNCNQSNSHLNTNSNNNQNLNPININNNNNINSHSSDSSSDLTIADNINNNCNNNNNRRNSYQHLVPVTTSAGGQVVVTAPNTTSTGFKTINTSNSGKFAVPQIPSQEHYVSVSTCMTSGGQTNSVAGAISHHQNGNTNSVLPPYSQSMAVNNSIYPMTIKVEPNQPKATSFCGPLSPADQSSLAPIDMADQERIKLERKRLRNRIAASKCRKRKLERISRLEDKVRGLKGENSELSIVVNKLRDQVCSLKQQVMNHVKCGCQLMAPQ